MKTHETIAELMTRHNTIVKEKYRVTDNQAFSDWLFTEAEALDECEPSERYIEIGKTEALCGHAVIFQFTEQTK